MLVSICVVQCTGRTLRLVKEWTIVKVDESSTLTNVFHDINVHGGVGPRAPDGPNDIATVTATISSSKIEGDAIPMDSAVGESVELFGRYIRFRIQSDEGEEQTTSPTEVKRPNAFDLLKQAQVNMKLPAKYQIKKPNKKLQIFNDFVDMLDDSDLKFKELSVETTGSNFVKSVTDTLWMLDPHVKTMSDRGCHVPALFKQFRGYNDPIAQKHVVKRLMKVDLMEQVEKLELIVDQPWMSSEKWGPMKKSVTDLAEMMHKYACYLDNKEKEVQTNHEALTPVRDMKEAQKVTVIQPRIIVKPILAARYTSLTDKLQTVEDFEILDLEEFVPVSTQERRKYLDNLGMAMRVRVIHFKVAYGNNLGSHHFIWKSPQVNGQDVDRNNRNIQKILEDLPTFHTRAMRRKFVNSCSLLTPNAKPASLRCIYRAISGDCSESTTENEKIIDQRARQAFDMEDPDIVMDLREHNRGQPPKYQIFFEKTKEYLENVVETAVDDRRNGQINHMAAAISAPDLLRQVQKLCPEGTPIPSEQWLRLQFAPKNPTSISSLQHTGLLIVKYAIQSRQFRNAHEDDHYASALFRYLKEFAVKYRDHVTFACSDDKHHAKVGEPGNPVAAVERGRRVITCNGVKFVVSDHDFTKFSIIPSVCMILDIPETMSGSFYRGQVYISIKDQVFEPSSPLRHATEMMVILEKQAVDKPIMCLYTDGGPDHRVTYLSVKLSLLYLFIARDLDMLVAVRTPPRGSWKNPPERIMGILNMGMQSVGLERKVMEKQFEDRIKSSSTLKGLRQCAEGDTDLKMAMIDSIESVKVLLSGIFHRLQLCERQFQTISSATEDMMQKLWHVLQRFGDVDRVTVKNQAELQTVIDNSPQLKRLMDHCCISRHYMFSIKKCGQEGCALCNRPRLPRDVFQNLHVLPDPVPATDGHYQQFSEVYGTETTEEHRPSLEEKKAKSHQIPFSPSAQTAKTVKRVAECTDCEKPRVIYSAKKLPPNDIKNLDKLLRVYEFSCGATLQELRTPDNSTPVINALVEKVYVRANLSCASPIEVPYYTSQSFKDLCFFCGTMNGIMTGPAADGMYPCCEACYSVKRDTEKPYKRKRNLFTDARAKIAKK